MAVLTSVELNYMVFRYLQESGFLHSAFAFGYEAGINKSPVDGDLVPPLALVKFVQKGLQFLEMEANLSSDEDDVADDFSFIEPFDLITKSVNELQKIVNERKAKLREERKKNNEKGSEPIDMDPSTPSISHKVLVSDVTVLEGHIREVLACAWSPDDSLLASVWGNTHYAHIKKQKMKEGEWGNECGSPPIGSVLKKYVVREGFRETVGLGSGDSTARIWPIPGGPCGSMNGKNISANAKVLKHFKGKTNEKCKDVLTLQWNAEGTLLATGSYDGQARIWTRDGMPDIECLGELRSELDKHRGTVVSLKWNKKGDFLLTGSMDRTTIVWDVKIGDCKQQFEFHTAAILDVDWRNNVQFASGSMDCKIYVCKVGVNRPMKTFLGHQGEVNSVKWDPTATLLASCSDDGTAKIWDLKHDEFLHDLRRHKKEIYSIRWSPTGPATSNPNLPLLLASASFDSTVKLWDVEYGFQVHSLEAHWQPVYAIEFSPNGEYLASGSQDQCIHIWSVKDRKVVKTYNGHGDVFDVCWNREVLRELQSDD
ncbi:Guanine nucleotide-binding protein subunit beta [Acorus gramineus]|uniref:Guanine nucleotide-binding protein subunit beta n=1 Tax=Acorus gramineus TaxID=55184 RepID=A0AAV9BKI5_ACOGR|nr:Guanine nucleotide-binding protein subunit beta [Acorus gramineus]